MARYLAYRVLAKEITPGEAAAEIPEIDWGKVAAVDDRIGKERDPVRRFAIGRSLPDFLAKRLLAQYGEEAGALADALNQRAPLTVRANTIKVTREELAARLRQDGIESRPTPLTKDGLVLQTRVNAFGLAAFREGLFEVQDEASQLVAELTAPPPGALVVDSCAGAGGKTLAVAASMKNKGRVVALDVSERKLEELRRRARRAGLSNVRAVAISPKEWPDEVERLRGKVDRVLVDAPCSGVGALRRNPEARWRLSEDDLVRLPREQEAILRRVIPLLSEGGRAIYATCTLLGDENEDVVSRVLASDKSLELVRVAELWGKDRAAGITDSSGTFLQLAPHRHDADGFFAAVLRKRGDRTPHAHAGSSSV